MERHLKCCVVGDEAVGKSSLLFTYGRNAFPEGDIPRALDDSSACLMIEDEQIVLHLCDTYSQRDYRKLRPLCYPQTDLFIICFSLVSPTSLENAQNVWIPEVREHCPTTPYILVGMKSDLRDLVAMNGEARDGTGMEAVPEAQGEAIKRAVNACAYLECSAKTQTNVKEVFEAATNAALHPPEVRIREDYEQGGSWAFCCVIFWYCCCCWPCVIYERCNDGHD
jgi:small GTP-binding protein